MKQPTLIEVVAVAAFILTIGTVLAMVVSAPSGTSTSTTSYSTTSTLATPSSSSTSFASSATQTGSASISQADPSDNLQLTLSLNTTNVPAGQPFEVTVSEYNMLSTQNNVSVSTAWAVEGLELGPCGSTSHPYQDPLGVAVFPGHYAAGNVSQGKPIAIYPAQECPVYVRSETGYVFQPLSDIAQVLPSDLSGSPGPISGSVTISRDYVGESPSSAGVPLSPGFYTIVGGDEWGILAFLYITVR